MLHDLIKDLQSTLRNFSKGLENKNLLVDIPWTMVDGDLNLQRLIFNRDNSLYIVKDGDIQDSKWEFLPAINSLIIEVGGRKILMNEVFADGKALILKKDGANLEFFSFANSKEIPDLNLVKYISSLENRQIDTNKEVIQVVNDPYQYPGSKPLGCVSIVLLLISISLLFIL